MSKQRPAGDRRDSGPGPQGEDAAQEPDDLPFPDSLCHQCAAPPRYIRTPRSTFVYCPILKRYPPQPVVRCDAFIPKVG